MSAVQTEQGSPAPGTFLGNPLAQRCSACLVLVAAAGLAFFLYSSYAESARFLWWGTVHDRHTHYVHGLSLAVDLRTGDWKQLLHDLDKFRVWGPLDPLMEASVQFVVGPNHRLAVLPSLTAWVLTVWLAFLLARRMAPSNGTAAGLIAALLVAVSPAHRAFATDAMLESPGACLTLLCLYCYLLVIQNGTPRSGVYLGVALSLLFLLKSNYWLLVVLGLLMAEFTRQPTAWLHYARSLFQRDRIARWLGGELRQPLNYLVLILIAAALALTISGGSVVQMGGSEISIRQPHNLIHLAYVALCLRLLIGWWRGGKACLTRWPRAARDVALWHGSVILFWFLLPKRLADLIWYLSPVNTDQHRESVAFMHGLPFYLQAVQDDYLVLSWGLSLFAVLLVLGFVAWPKLKPGGSAVFFVFLVAAFLTCQHPMLKNRFLHSWIALAAVIAAVGLVQAVQQTAGLLSHRLRPWSAAFACVAMALLNGGAVLAPGHAQESGIKTDRPTGLEITDVYLPQLAGTKQPTILSNIPMRFLTAWTYLEHRKNTHFIVAIKDFKARMQHDEEQIRCWLQTTSSDAVVLIDISPESPFFASTTENVDLTTFEHVLDMQHEFVRAHRWESVEGVSISLWQRRNAVK